MYAVLDASGLGEELEPHARAKEKFPMEILREFSNAVLDEETGDMLEYRHLIKHPKF